MTVDMGALLANVIDGDLARAVSIPISKYSYLRERRSGSYAHRLARDSNKEPSICIVY